MSLLLRERRPTSVFDLMGRSENSVTYAIGWCLEQCPAFLQAFASHVSGTEVFGGPEPVVLLQQGGADGGYTDVEIHWGDQFAAVIEAKIGWEIPSVEQLRRYRGRLGSGSKKAVLVSLSAATQEVARLKLPNGVDGVPTIHVSYGELRQLAKRTRDSTRQFAEKQWLEQLICHLEHYAAMNREESNRVFIVSLSAALVRPDQPLKTWIDIVEKDNSYFHPIGGGWPKEPPNYIGFRYGGQLRTIHRVEEVRTALNVCDLNPDWEHTTTEHFIYTLGPAMRPPSPMGAGGPLDTVRMATHRWCDIDTLLTGQFQQLGEAVAETNARRARAESLSR